MIERIYLDSCALNRLSDDLRQPRIREESEAVEQILDAVGRGLLYWVASTHLQAELLRGSDSTRRQNNLALIRRAKEIVQPTSSTLELTRGLASHGIDPPDALHLALALEARAQTFLTTDDRLIRRAQRAGTTPMLVDNPVHWFRRRRPWLLPNP